MNNPNSKPDDLTKTANKADVELTEEQLKRASGGYKEQPSISDIVVTKPTDKTSPL